MNKYYESVADIFCQHGIDRCFALLGDANMHWAGAMHERGVTFGHLSQSLKKLLMRSLPPKIKIFLVTLE